MEEYKEFSIDSFTKMCRLCLVIDELEPLTKEIENGLLLSDIIFLYASIQVGEDDKMPTNVCKNCSIKMQETHMFIEKCKKSDEVLKTIILRAEQISEKFDCKAEVNDPLELEEKQHSKVFEDHDYFENDEAKSDDADSVKEEELFKVEDSNLENEDELTSMCIRRIRKRSASIRKYNKSQLVFKNETPKKRHKPVLRADDGPPFICPMCHESFEKYADLKKHRVEQKHLRPLNHFCPYCNKGFNHTTRLKEHIRTHTGEKPNPCPTCDRRFNSKVDLRRHMFTHSNIKRYKCQYCDKGYNRKFGLRDHERTHTGERLYCTCCGKEFTSYCTLYQHEKKKKYNVSIYQRYQKGQFPCNMCNKVLTTEQSLKQHVLLHGPKNFNCEKCGRTYVSQQRLNDHIKKGHKAKDQVCTLCEKTFKSHKALVAHYMKSHAEGEEKPASKKEFPCHICGRVCVTKQTMENHVLQHGPKNITCDICGKAYASEKRLKIHIAYSHNDKEYSCPICAKVYKSKDGFEYHMKNHTGENVHVCEVCSKEFKCKSSLRDHMRIHTGETKFKCPQCDRVCLNKRKYEDHLRVHTGERPFGCSVCGKAFAIPTNLNTHMRIHTGEKKHLCVKCGKGFYDARNLRKHMQTHGKKGTQDTTLEEIKIIIE